MMGFLVWHLERGGGNWVCEMGGEGLKEGDRGKNLYLSREIGWGFGFFSVVGWLVGVGFMDDKFCIWIFFFHGDGDGGGSKKKKKNTKT